MFLYNFKYKKISFYLGVDTRVVSLSTSIAPGNNSLQLTVAHNRATRITLTTKQMKIIETYELKLKMYKLNY